MGDDEDSRTFENFDDFKSMREIKFRAWDKEEKKMWWNVQNAYDTLGSYCKHEDEDDLNNCSCIETSYPHKMMSFMNVLEDESLITMQYTGLKDRNKTEIYEGDCLRYYNRKGSSFGHSVHIVIWQEHKGRFALEIPDDKSNEPRAFTNHGAKWDEEKFTVIGNIYENPELLKV